MSASPRSALVLGGGIMGLSAAWALSRAGCAVRLIDQDFLPNPRGASVDHHRLIRHAYGAEAGYMRMVDAAYRAWELLWRDLGERLYHPTGVLALAGAPGGGNAGWVGASRATLLAGGHAVQMLDAAAVAARWPMLSPEGVGDAFHLAPGGVLLARRIVAALAEHLRRRGVVFERARVVEARPELAALHLADGRDRVADLLVIAAGPWAPRLLGAPLAEHVTASRQILVLLEPPRPRHAAWARAPMLLDLEEDGGFYAVPPVAGTPLKIGDHRFSLAGDPEADPREATPQEAERILALARRRIRDLDEYRVLGARACYYDVEPQQRFVVEPVGPRSFVMSGFSGHGFKFGPLLGLALARAAGDAGLVPGLAAWAAGLEDPPFGLLADLEETEPSP